MSNIIACIYEGASERAILEILLNNNRLNFTRDDLLEQNLHRRQSGKRFSEEHLNRSFGDSKISIYIVNDSKSEKFTIPKIYKKKVVFVEKFLTCPEIEILVIISEGKYEE